VLPVIKKYFLDEDQEFASILRQLPLQASKIKTFQMLGTIIIDANIDKAGESMDAPKGNEQRPKQKQHQQADVGPTRKQE
jgi:hypothetical protein